MLAGQVRHPHRQAQPEGLDRGRLHPHGRHGGRPATCRARAARPASVPPVPLLLPRVAAVVVAVLLPEAGLVVVHHPERRPPTSRSSRSTGAARAAAPGRRARAASGSPSCSVTTQALPPVRSAIETVGGVAAVRERHRVRRPVVAPRAAGVDRTRRESSCRASTTWSRSGCRTGTSSNGSSANSAQVHSCSSATMPSIRKPHSSGVEPRRGAGGEHRKAGLHVLPGRHPVGELLRHAAASTETRRDEAHVITLRPLATPIFVCS